jgi:hypothetical protein
VKICEDFALNWLLHHGNTPSHTSFFTWEFLTRNNMTVVPNRPYFLLFPPLKGTIEVIEAEVQAMLTLSQNKTSRMHLKNGRSAGNGAYMREGTTSRVMVANRPKLVFHYGWMDGWLDMSGNEHNQDCKFSFFLVSAAGVF